MRDTRKPRKTLARHDFADKSRGERLQKVLADAGVASRRECEALILGGAVTVNDHLVDSLPAWVDPDNDRVEVHGRPLRKPEKHVYIVLFKPRGTVCTNSDPEGRPRAIDLVNHPSRPRLYCVGRLDLDASGLLVLTNDGEFANRLTHPRYGVTKGYDLVIDGSLGNEDIERIEREIFKAGRGSEMRSSLRLLKRDRDKTTVHLELAEHRNLQIKPLMMEVGHPVNKMRRTSFGPLKLKGLAVGEWRELTPREVEQLRTASRGADVAPARSARTPRRSMEDFAVQREERARTRELELDASNDGAAGDAGAESRRPERRATGSARAARSTHPAREARGTQRDARSPQRDARSPQRDARGPQREDRGPQRDARGSQRDARGPQRDARGPQRDARGPQRDGRGPQRDARGSSRPEGRAPAPRGTRDSRASRAGEPRSPRPERGGAARRGAARIERGNRGNSRGRAR